MATRDSRPSSGYVLDYDLIDSDQENITFQTGTTYLVTAPVNLGDGSEDGSAVIFQSGAVIKFTADASSGLFYDPFDASYPSLIDAPAVLTSKDDNSVGEIIPDSTGDPLTLTNVIYLCNIESEVQNLNFYYAGIGICDSDPAYVFNCQFYHCSQAINLWQGELDLFNDLFSDCFYPVFYSGSDLVDYSQGVYLYAQNCTADSGIQFETDGGFWSESYNYYNCLTTRFVEGFGDTVDGDFENSIQQSSTSCYTTFGNADFYLKPTSLFHGAGAAGVFIDSSISANLLTQLESMTTYSPPDGSIPDTSGTDIGYHYPTNEDSMYDGVPDWWEYKYFGETGISSTNVDVDGNTLLYDYQHNADPDVINFTVTTTNGYVNTPNQTLQLVIDDGIPDYEAVLINNTNTADAIWEPYTTTNLPVDLGSSNGAYTILVGLRGLPSNAVQTWRQTSITLNESPLILTVTNPAGDSVSKPMIQLEGYASGELAGLSFDVSNALVDATNLAGYFTDELYDTNLMHFTTSYFQCYDVMLTNGLNNITICATDILGQVTTTNLTITLNYSGDTTPPNLIVTWPQNGTQISGNSFTFHGTVDDDTAKITAQIIDAENDTNIVQGIVERDGTVTIGGLPISSGDNSLTITAADAAGNFTTTNLTVDQSSVMVTFDPLATDELNQTNVSVTGSISDTNEDVCIWVNGIQGYYLDDLGDWEADNVPANSSGTAIFDVELYIDDPIHIGSQLFTQVQPAYITLADFKQYDDMDDTYGEHEKFTVNWTFAKGGSWSLDYLTTTDSGQATGNIMPDSTNYDLPITSYGYYDYHLGGTTWYSWTGQFSPIWQSAQTVFHEDDGSYLGSVQTTLMVVPDGPKLPTITKTYDVQACALTFSDPLYDNDFWGIELAPGAMAYPYSDTPVPPGQLLLDGRSLVSIDVTNDDDSVWGTNSVSAMAGTLIPLRLTSAGNYDYTFNMEIVKDRLYWQNMVQSEIDADSSVVVENYLANNGFMANRQNIQAVYAFYQKLFTERPTEFYWAGLAKLAGAPVYAGLSDAEFAKEGSALGEALYL
ncbi:MAG TPA: hypothetical protein VGN23_12820 [Verrucomicrobiae bacterium]